MVNTLKCHQLVFLLKLPITLLYSSKIIHCLITIWTYSKFLPMCSSIPSHFNKPFQNNIQTDHQRFYVNLPTLHVFLPLMHDFQKKNEVSGIPWHLRENGLVKASPSPFIAAHIWQDIAAFYRSSHCQIDDWWFSINYLVHVAGIAGSRQQAKISLCNIHLVAFPSDLWNVNDKGLGPYASRLT